MKKSWKLFFIVVSVLVIDQAVKIWVKTHLWLSQEIEIFGFDWALIHFMENNGMAFGIAFGGSHGKLALSIFRIIAISFLVYLLRSFIRSGARWGILIPFSLILAGAIGNILDSAFYGVIFSESGYFHGGVARIFPAEGGYANFLHGRVVDMFHFPMFRGYWPDWLPVIGGRPYLFFKPVFNIADVAITSGVLHILFFERSFFLGDIENHAEESADEEE